MSKRISIKNLEPEAYNAMMAMENYASGNELCQTLKSLIKIRVSQINGCAYCIDLHTEEALKLGESERRLFLISAWKESNLFTNEEKAVLRLAEEVTNISDGLSDETYAEVIRFYNEKNLAQMIMQTILMNSWNRIALSTKMSR